MMTIKIINKEVTDVETRTYLFEVGNPRYNIISYENFKDHCTKWGELTEGNSIPAHSAMRCVQESDGPGSFLAIHYRADNGELCFIGTRHSIVYIMHEGKTIDTIYC